MHIAFIAMSGVRAASEELNRIGMTLPGFVERSRVIASLPSLSLLTLAGLTPDDVEISYHEIPDIRLLGELPACDVAAIASYSAQIKDAYALADRYRALGVRAVLGGLHVTARPEEAARAVLGGLHSAHSPSGSCPSSLATKRRPDPSTGPSPVPTSARCCAASTSTRPRLSRPSPHDRGDDDAMPAPPASTKSSLAQWLTAHARRRWPALSGVEIRFHGPFAYVEGNFADGEFLPLCRLRYVGSAARWGFAIYRASHDDYQDNVLPSGQFVGTPEEALDCACSLYLRAVRSSPTN